MEDYLHDMALMQDFAALGRQIIKEVIMDGIFTTSVNEDKLDECPMAYKPMEEIASHIAETVTIDHIIRPIYNFKASEHGGRRRKQWGMV